MVEDKQRNPISRSCIDDMVKQFETKTAWENDVISERSETSTNSALGSGEIDAGSMWQVVPDANQLFF